MEKVNMNKKIREQINSVNESYKKANGGGFSLFEEENVRIMLDSYNEVGQRFANIINIFIDTTGYSDMYTSLVLKQKVMELTDAEHEYLKMLKEIDSYDKLQIMYEENPKMYSIAVKEMIRFYNSSVYHKILRMKCLSDEDIKQISKINTIFNQDLDSYNIDIDLDYIINRILKFKARGNDEKTLLNDAAAFINTMMKVDRRNAFKMVLEMFKNNIILVNFKGDINKGSAGREILDLYCSDINFLINYLNFQDIYSLLDLSLMYFMIKQDADSVPLCDECRKTLNEVKKYELEMDKNV